MGTSTKLPGPKGRWTIGSRVRREPALRGEQESEADHPVLSRPLPPEKVEEYAQTYLDALRSDLCTDPRAYGLLNAAHRAGERLTEVMAGLTHDGIASLGLGDESTPDEHADAFIARFTDQVAVCTGLPADAAVRRACVRTAERLLEKDARVRAAVEGGTDLTGWLVDELFCELYRMFFADIVQEFLHTMITANIALAVPVLPTVDPAGLIAHSAAKVILQLIPTPCKESDRRADGSPLHRLGRELAGEALERALGLSSEEAA